MVWARGFGRKTEAQAAVLSGLGARLAHAACAQVRANMPGCQTKNGSYPVRMKEMRTRTRLLLLLLMMMVVLFSCRSHGSSSRARGSRSGSAPDSTQKPKL